VLSLSFGKDSMALLIEVLKRKLPLDYVIFCDIKFNDKISGEHPLMSEWIPQAEKVIKDRFGVNIIHLTAKKNFTEQFYTIKQKGNHIGDRYGFPYTIDAWCNDRLKLQPIKQFIQSIIKNYGAVTEYIGIAKDEPKRLKRYKELENEKHKYITLADLDIDELQAMEICRQHNLLSPKYEKSFRGGCWFCPKQSMSDLYELWKNYPNYFEMLAEIEGDSFNTFKPNKTIKQIKQEFDNGKKPKKKKRSKQISIFD
jgi:3'-phosphoadenosine 5'-phosphosulfate sulfotransferase (PAPS reductase)/FAD synthetase